MAACDDRPEFDDNNLTPEELARRAVRRAAYEAVLDGEDRIDMLRELQILVGEPDVQRLDVGQLVNAVEETEASLAILDEAEAAHKSALEHWQAIMDEDG